MRNYHRAVLAVIAGAGVAADVAASNVLWHNPGGLSYYAVAAAATLLAAVCFHTVIHGVIRDWKQRAR